MKTMVFTCLNILSLLLFIIFSQIEENGFAKSLCLSFLVLPVLLALRSSLLPDVLVRASLSFSVSFLCCYFAVNIRDLVNALNQWNIDLCVFWCAVVWRSTHCDHLQPLSRRCSLRTKAAVCSQSHSPSLLSSLLDPALHFLFSVRIFVVARPQVVGVSDFPTFSGWRKL